MIISDAFAQTAGVAAAGSTMCVVVQLFLIFIIFYFILIRPQQKKIKQHEAMLSAIKRGDKVVTGGGVYGVVEKDNGDMLDVKIAEGVVVAVYRATVRQVVDEMPQKASVVKTKK